MSSFLWENTKHEPKQTEEQKRAKLHVKKSGKLQLRDKVLSKGKSVCMPWLVVSCVFLPFVCLHVMLLDILQVASHVIF